MPTQLRMSNEFRRRPKRPKSLPSSVGCTPICRCLQRPGRIQACWTWMDELLGAFQCYWPTISDMCCLCSSYDMLGSSVAVEKEMRSFTARSTTPNVGNLQRTLSSSHPSSITVSPLFRRVEVDFKGRAACLSCAQAAMSEHAEHV